MQGCERVSNKDICCREPELVGDDLTLWSKYYHRSYGKGGASNSFYRDVYGADATDMAVKQKTVLGQMRDMKQVLSTDRTKLLGAPFFSLHFTAGSGVPD